MNPDIDPSQLAALFAQLGPLAPVALAVWLEWRLRVLLAAAVAPLEARVSAVEQECAARVSRPKLPPEPPPSASAAVVQ